MEKGKIRKTAACAAAALLFLCACEEVKYKVDYCGEKGAYIGAKDAYRTGETVTLYYDLIGTDTDYSFYLDDKQLKTDYEPEKGYILKFVMPGHDVKLECRTENTMYHLEKDGEDE
jgi:hypothetical protein